MTTKFEEKVENFSKRLLNHMQDLFINLSLKTLLKKEMDERLSEKIDVSNWDDKELVASIQKSRIPL